MTKAKTKANIFVVVGIVVSILLSIGVITYSIMQGRDMKAVFYRKDHSFCQQTLFNEYRPFQAQLSFKHPGSSANETATMKVCADFLRAGNVVSGETLSSAKNWTTTCLFVDTPRTSSGEIDSSKMLLHCGWSTKEQVRRISIVSGQLIFALVGLLWLIFASKIWGKIIGFVYMALVALSAVGMGWLSFADINALWQSRRWCTSTYAKKICNFDANSPTMTCGCEYATFSGTAILDVLGVFIYVLLLVACIYRIVTYFYREDDDELSGHLSQLDNEEKTSLTSSQDTDRLSYGETPSERRAREIYSSYGYQ